MNDFSPWPTSWLEPREPESILDDSPCELCGEAADAEMGEFWDKAADKGVLAHAQCGVDAGFELA